MLLKAEHNFSGNVTCSQSSKTMPGCEYSSNFAQWCTAFTAKISILSLRRCTDCSDGNYSLWSSVIYHYGLYTAMVIFQVQWASLRYAGPTASNRLPEHIHHQSTPVTFRRHLETFLFADTFNTT